MFPLPPPLPSSKIYSKVSSLFRFGVEMFKVSLVYLESEASYFNTRVI